MAAKSASGGFFRRTGWVWAFLCLTTQGFPASSAADDELAGLLLNNPFEPERKPPPPRPPKPGVNIRLWGYVVDRGKFTFNLNESLSGRAAWVPVGRSSGPFTIKNFDAVTGQLSVEYDGHVFELQVRSRPVDPVRPSAASRH